MTTSKQRDWQRKQVAAGNCQTCGQPRDGKSTVYCEKHRLLLNDQRKRRYHDSKTL